MNFLRTHAVKLYPLLIITVGVLAYCNTFQVPFVFDDDFNIVTNTAIRDFSSFLNPQIRQAGPPQRIVGYLSLALNYRLNGLDVTGYHIFNLCIHLLNALLVYALVRLTFRTPWLTAPPVGGRQDGGQITALFAALLFVAHPVQTQAVTYIIQRLASLATLFYLASLTAYVKMRLAQSADRPRTVIAAWYVLALTAAVLAMKTKEIAFTLPVMAFCYELIFFKGPLVRRLAGLLPLALTMLIIPLTMLGVGRSPQGLIDGISEATRLMTPLSRSDYLFTQFRVIVTYLRLLILPVDQRLDYDFPVFHSLLTPAVLASFLLLLALAGCAALLLVRAVRGTTTDQGSARFISFCILWFFIALSVESSLVPIVDVIFEHRVYLPSVGFCMAGAFAGTRFFPVRTGVTVLVCAVVLLGVGTFRRNMIWGDEVRLWLDNETKSPNKVRGYTQLGKAYRKLGRDDLTVACYSRCIARNPEDPEAYNNRGNAYYRLKRPDLALADFDSAIRLEPGFALPYYNRGMIYRDQHQYDKALADYQRAVALDPALDRIHLNLGYAYAQLGRHDKAIEAYSEEILRQPESGEAYYNRGISYRRSGRTQEAEADLKTAGRLGIRR